LVFLAIIAQFPKTNFMHEDHEKFIHAIKEKRKVLLTYFNEEYNKNVTCLCVPLYYGPLNKKHHHDCYYFWEPEAEIGKRLLAIPIWQTMIMELTEETFEPREFIAYDKR